MAEEKVVDKFSISCLIKNLNRDDANALKVEMDNFFRLKNYKFSVRVDKTVSKNQNVAQLLEVVAKSIVPNVSLEIDFERESIELETLKNFEEISLKGESHLFHLSIF